MARLINADEAFRVLSDYYHHRTGTQAAALREALDRVPEVVVNENEYIIREISYPDATIQKVIGELVRCKDCRLTDEPIYEKDEHDYWCREHSLYVYENDYCSYGERREDGVDR